MQRRILHALAYLLAVSPLLASAQTGTVTGTGSTTENDEVVWTERSIRTHEFLKNETAFQKYEDAFFTQDTNRRQKLNDHRRDCTDAIRRANRDSTFSVTLQCYRTDLTLIRDIIAKQQEFVSSLPGTTLELRTDADAKSTALLDAISTIMKAIEAGVYRTENELLESKQNLWEKYRDPYRDVLALLRIDRTLTWTMHMLTQLHAVESNPETAEELSPTISEAKSCFVASEQALKTILSERAAQFREVFRQEQSRLKSCGEIIQNTENLNTKVDQ